jgi:hypothetical protein
LRKCQQLTVMEGEELSSSQLFFAANMVCLEAISAAANNRSARPAVATMLRVVQRLERPTGPLTQKTTNRKGRET